MELQQLKRILEAAILAAGRPVTLERLSSLFEGAPPDRAELKLALDAIAADCAERGFELRQVASGYRFQVRTELADWVGRLWEEKPPRYSRALLETLALIAYRQPITRGDIEEIRGVSVASSTMQSLLEREWIRVVGHRDVPGRPALYATTRGFLDYFNLRGLDELPPLAEIRDLDRVDPELQLQLGGASPNPAEPTAVPAGESTPLTGAAGVPGARAEEAPGAVTPEPLLLREDSLEPLDGSAAEDADLAAIDARVSSIEENLRNFMEGRKPEAAPE